MLSLKIPEVLQLDLKEGSSEVWWGRIVQALTIYREYNRARLAEYCKKEASAVITSHHVQEHKFDIMTG